MHPADIILKTLLPHIFYSCVLSFNKMHNTPSVVEQEIIFGDRNQTTTFSPRSIKYSVPEHWHTLHAKYLGVGVGV